MNKLFNSVQVALPGAEPRLNSPRATECQVTVFPGKNSSCENLRRLFIEEEVPTTVLGLGSREEEEEEGGRSIL